MSGLTDDISPRLPEGPRCEPVLQTFASVEESPRAHEYSPPLTVPVATMSGTIHDVGSVGSHAPNSHLFPQVRESSVDSVGRVRIPKPVFASNSLPLQPAEYSDCDDDFPCLPDDDTSVVGENEIVPVATIEGTIRLSDHKTGKVTEVLYDETQIFLWQFGYSNFRVDDRQVVLLVEAGKVWLYPGQHQKVGVSNGPKQPTIVVKSRCQSRTQSGCSNFRVDDRQVVLLVEDGKVWLYPGLHQKVGVRKGPKQPTIVVKDWYQLFDKYEFTLGVTTSPFEGDTESHMAKAKNVLLGLRADDKQKQAVETEVECRHRVQDEDGTKSSFDFDFVVRVLALPPSQPIPALHRNSAISDS